MDPCIGCDGAAACTACAALRVCRFTTFASSIVVPAACAPGTAGGCNSSYVVCAAPDARSLRANVVSLDPFIAAVKQPVTLTE